MREALELVNEALAAERLRIVTRTGVNTGEVIAAETARTRRSPPATPSTSRHGSAGRAGRAKCSSARPRRLVRDAVVAEPAPAVAAKGKTAPVAAWRLVALRPDVPAFTRPSEPFVGRAARARRAARRVRPASREASAVWRRSSGRPGSASRAWHASPRSFREARARRRPVRRVRRRHHLPPARRLVRQVAGAEPEPVIGVPGRGRARPSRPADRARSARRRARHRRRRVGLPPSLRGARGVAPSVVSWTTPLGRADAARPLEYLVGFSSGAPVLLLCLARPDLFDAGRPGRARRDALVRSRRYDDETDGLVADLRRAASRGGARRILDAAEGDPLFVEQMFAMLADDARPPGAVPATIHALLAARIDRLPPAERTVLERASIEGGCSTAARSRRCSAAGRGRARRHAPLPRAQGARSPRPLAVRGDDGFRFSHMLIRDVAYGSMPKELRAELHPRLAAWLEARAAGISSARGDRRLPPRAGVPAHAELGVSTEAPAPPRRRAVGCCGPGGRRRSIAASRRRPRLSRRACRLLEPEPRERAVLPLRSRRRAPGRGALEAADMALDRGDRGGGPPRRRADGLRAEIEHASVACIRALLVPTTSAPSRPAPSPCSSGSTATRTSPTPGGDGFEELAAGARRGLPPRFSIAAGTRWPPATSGGRSRPGTSRRRDAFGPHAGRRRYSPSRRGARLGAGTRGPRMEADALLGGPYLSRGWVASTVASIERSKAVCRKLGIA